MRAASAAPHAPHARSRPRRGHSTPLCRINPHTGSGKTALAAQLAVQSGFPFVKLISADSMLGMSDSGRCAHIAAVFNDAYKSPMSMIILDDLERLLGAWQHPPLRPERLPHALLTPTPTPL